MVVLQCCGLVNERLNALLLACSHKFNYVRLAVVLSAVLLFYSKLCCVDHVGLALIGSDRPSQWSYISRLKIQNDEWTPIQREVLK